MFWQKDKKKDTHKYGITIRFTDGSSYGQHRDFDANETEEKEKYIATCEDQFSTALTTWKEAMLVNQNGVIRVLDIAVIASTIKNIHKTNNTGE